MVFGHAEDTKAVPVLWSPALGAAAGWQMAWLPLAEPALGTPWDACDSQRAGVFLAGPPCLPAFQHFPLGHGIWIHCHSEPCSCWQRGQLPVPIRAPKGQHTAAACASNEKLLPPTPTLCVQTHANVLPWPVCQLHPTNTCWPPANATHVLQPQGTRDWAGEWLGRAELQAVCLIHPPPSPCVRGQVLKDDFRVSTRGAQLFSQEEIEAEHRIQLCGVQSCSRLPAPSCECSQLGTPAHQSWRHSAGGKHQVYLQPICSDLRVGTGMAQPDSPVPHTHPWLGTPCRDVVGFSSTNVRS